MPSLQNNDLVVYSSLSKIKNQLTRKQTIASARERQDKVANAYM